MALVKACVVFCTIRPSKSFALYAKNFLEFGHKPDIMIVDEEGNTRKHVLDALSGLDVEFYGTRERKEWFRTKNVDSSIVPVRSTDVIGFSLLMAYPREYDMMVFLDDDTHPLEGYDFLGEHWDNLNYRKLRVISSSNKWVNPHPRKYPRGYPYSLRNSDLYREEEYKIGSILNMGLWEKIPDLNALDYLFYGSLEGRYEDLSHIPLVSHILCRGNYMPLSRMNVGFLPKIIPAFYQCAGKEYGGGRYGDVFSGLFLEKISSHLGDNISFGQPICIHDKEPRDVFGDIKSEIENIKLNEELWMMLDKIELSGNSYSFCYEELADGLLGNKNESIFSDYIAYLAKKMKEWVKITEELE